MNNKKAVAIGYDGYNTPTVKAKGYQELAEHLLKELGEQGCLIHEDETLMKWLENLNVGDEIPETLFIVIAELIAYAWVLEGKTPPGWEGDKPINEEV